MTSRILIIDDEIHSVKFIEKYLKNKGYDILTASNGKEGISKAKKELPDLTILDVRLPGMDGLTVCQKLREDKSTQRLPIIMLSAKVNCEDKISGFKAGADDYITKPFDLQELLVRIEGLLWRSHIAKRNDPLTDQSGNFSIEDEITKRINSNSPYAVCYLNLNNLKEYVNKYGRTRGDKIVLKSAEIIGRTVSLEGNPNDFIGHSDTGDFIIITTPEKVDSICSCIIKDFDESILSFYTKEYLQKGLLVQSRNKLQFPVVFIAIGIVTNEWRTFTNPLLVSAVATEMKQYAKTFKISNYKKDKRVG